MKVIGLFSCGKQNTKSIIFSKLSCICFALGIIITVSLCKAPTLCSYIRDTATIAQEVSAEVIQPSDISRIAQLSDLKMDSPNIITKNISIASEGFRKILRNEIIDEILLGTHAKLQN